VIATLRAFQNILGEVSARVVILFSHPEMFACPLQCDFHIRQGAVIKPVRNHFKAALSVRALGCPCGRESLSIHEILPRIVLGKFAMDSLGSDRRRWAVFTQARPVLRQLVL
jgi:hypothetical protein